MYAALSTGFVRWPLGNDHWVYSGKVPKELVPSRYSKKFDPFSVLRRPKPQFDQFWSLRPKEPHQVLAPFQGYVDTPRRQAAFGANYGFAGQVLLAEPTPPSLIPYRDWARLHIDPRINGLLLNWYQGPEEYIGPHNDEDQDLFVGSRIITVAFGEDRKLRMRPNGGKGFVDIPFSHGTFIVIPLYVNQHWKHEIPKSTKYTGRRISITMRSFTGAVVDD